MATRWCASRVEGDLFELVVRKRAEPKALGRITGACNPPSADEVAAHRVGGPAAAARW